MKIATNKNQTESSSDSMIRLLLTCGTIAGPFYLAVGIFQMLIRPGFDPSRHDLSLMSNGELGWIQITNFIVTGLLTIAAAFGMWKVLHDSPGGTWGSLLIGLYGLGFIGAGIFVADPANGFPPGSSVETPVISSSGIMHFVTGGIGFLGFIAACLVFARRFSSLKEKVWTRFSRITAILFFAAFVGIAMGSQPGSPILSFVTLGFWVAVIVGWTWFSLLIAKFRKELT